MTVWYLLCCLGKKGRNINTTGRTETTRTCLPPSLPHQENTLRSIIHPQYLHFSPFFLSHTSHLHHYSPTTLAFSRYPPHTSDLPPITQLLPSSESTLFSLTFISPPHPLNSHFFTYGLVYFPSPPTAYQSLLLASLRSTQHRQVVPHSPYPIQNSPSPPFFPNKLISQACVHLSPSCLPLPLCFQSASVSLCHRTRPENRASSQFAFPT